VVRKWSVCRERDVNKVVKKGRKVSKKPSQESQMRLCSALQALPVLAPVSLSGSPRLQVPCSPETSNAKTSYSRWGFTVVSQ